MRDCQKQGINNAMENNGTAIQLPALCQYRFGLSKRIPGAFYLSGFKIGCFLRQSVYNLD